MDLEEGGGKWLLIFLFHFLFSPPHTCTLKSLPRRIAEKENPSISRLFTLIRTLHQTDTSKNLPPLEKVNVLKSGS